MRTFNMIFPEGITPRKSRKPVRVLGIDLGTTNSTVAEIVYDPTSKGDISVRCLAVEQPTGSQGVLSSTPLTQPMTFLNPNSNPANASQIINQATMSRLNAR